MSIEVNGELTKVWAEKIRGQLWVHANGRTFVYEPVKKSRRREGHSEAIKHGEIKAPMPGKIIKVRAQVGQIVSEKEPIVVMEAMKMEYTLEAEVSGVVKQLNCSEGDQVSLGQLLAVIDDQGDANAN